MSVELKERRSADKMQMMLVYFVFFSFGGLTLAINKIVQSNFIVGLSLFAYIWR